MEEDKNKVIEVATHIGKIKVNNDSRQRTITFANEGKEYTFDICKEHVTSSDNKLVDMLNCMCEISNSILGIIESISIILNELSGVKCKVYSYVILGDSRIDRNNRIIFIEFDAPSKAGMIFIYSNMTHKFTEVFTFDRENIGATQHRGEYIPGVHGLNPRFKETIPIVSFVNRHVLTGLSTYIDNYFEGLSIAFIMFMLTNTIGEDLDKGASEKVQLLINTFLDKFKIPDGDMKSANLRISSLEASFSNIHLGVYRSMIKIDLDTSSATIPEDRQRFTRRRDIEQAEKKNVGFNGFARVKPRLHDNKPEENEVVFDESTGDVQYRVTISERNDSYDSNIKEILSHIKSDVSWVYENSKSDKYILIIKKREMATSLLFINKILEALDSSAVKVKIEKLRSSK